jgi:hypothetical protein
MRINPRCAAAQLRLPATEGTERYWIWSGVNMSRISLGQVLLLAALAVLLVFTAVWIVSALNASEDAVGHRSVIALALGTCFSLVLGCWLMALMFFSSRAAYDEDDPSIKRTRPK